MEKNKIEKLFAKKEQPVKKKERKKRIYPPSELVYKGWDHTQDHLKDITAISQATGEKEAPVFRECLTEGIKVVKERKNIK